MIKNIIFDFGDIFFNLDKEVVYHEIERFGGIPELSQELIALGMAYEVGKISSDAFVEKLKVIYPKATSDEIISIWNAMLLDFPDYRLEFLERLRKENKYRLFLLSNTNDLHILHVEKTMGTNKYNRFKDCFEKFYLSYEIQLRKPDADIFEFVLRENALKAEETLFIDDTEENITTAEKMGIKTWHLEVGQEDVVDLKTRLSHD